MSMGTTIVGFRPTDELWKKMKSVWDACKKAKIEVPSDVVDFFGGEYPGDKPGQEVEIKAAIKEWGDDNSEGFEVDIQKLPSGVRYLRFYNSW